MKSLLRLQLSTSPSQTERLLALQQMFAQACNAVAPLVQQTRTWNRVALHHLAYRQLREAFPSLGSQMACNAIYSVSRTCRIVYQTPGSPLHHTLWVGRPLPKLHFQDTAPVYFDRHTLSIRQGQASMYTLDGRMKFELALTPEHEAAFHQRRLLEVSLHRRAERFELRFQFGEMPANLNAHAPLGSDASDVGVGTDAHEEDGFELDHSLSAAGVPVPRLPAYLRVEEPA